MIMIRLLNSDSSDDESVVVAEISADADADDELSEGTTYHHLIFQYKNEKFHETSVNNLTH